MAARSYASLTLARGISAAAQMVLLVLVARATDASTFGLLAATFGVLSVLATVADFGVATVSMRYAARDQLEHASRIARMSERVCLAAGVVALTVLVTLGLTAYPVLLLLAPLALWSLAEKNGETWGLIHLAVGSERLFMSVVAGRRVLALVIFVLGWALSVGHPVLLFSSALAVSSAAGWILLRVRAVPLVPSAGAAPLSALWEHRAFAINALAGQIRDLDAFLVTAFASAAVAGPYGLGARLWQPVLIAANAAVNLVLRDTTRLGLQGTHQRMRRAWWPLPVAAVLGPLLVLLLAPVLRWAVPWLDDAGVATIASLGVATLFIGYGSIIATALVSCDDEAFVSRANILFALVHVALVAVTALVAPGWVIGLAVAVPYIAKVTLFQHRLGRLARREEQP